MDIIHAKPILKWVGGKRDLLNEIDSRFPFKRYDKFNYIETCVGGGAVLFWVLRNFPNVQKVIINDLNTDLINMYKAVQDTVEDVIALLAVWEKEYHNLSDNEEEKKEYYYAKRVLFNTRSSAKITHAALFIFLNKTGFNGLYRVNKKNEFNVPIGNYSSKATICDSDNLRVASQALKKVTILQGDFEATLFHAKGNETCFYIDPPYKPISKSSNFTSYAITPFDDNEQTRLKQFCDLINSQGHKWILSNSDLKNEDTDNDYFDELYADYHIGRVQTKRRINSKSSGRGNVYELMITNYKSLDSDQLVA